MFEPTYEKGRSESKAQVEYKAARLAAAQAAHDACEVCKKMAAIEILLDHARDAACDASRAYVGEDVNGVLRRAVDSARAEVARLEDELYAKRSPEADAIRQELLWAKSGL
jgi:outer membrane PBP1 activator LpoA protein